MTELEIKATIKKLRSLTPTLEILYQIERLSAKLNELQKTKQHETERI